MFQEYFDSGGPVMYAVFGLWVLVLAGILDRMIYTAGRAWRRPYHAAAALVLVGRNVEARLAFDRERDHAETGLRRIDSLSQLATSVGLFGTVLGIARSFFARGGELGLAAPEVLASGLSTALFTTIAGLIVFLVGQLFLIAYGEWQTVCDRGYEELLRGGQSE